MSDPAELEGFAQLPRRDFFILYGEILYLLARTAVHRSYTIADMEQRVLQPVGRDQFRLYRGRAGPLALLTWAFVSDALHARLQEEVVDLAPEEWNSGPHLWYMDFVAPFGHGGLVIDDVLTNVFPDRVGMAQRAKLSQEKAFVLRTYYGKNIKPRYKRAADKP